MVGWKGKVYVECEVEESRVGVLALCLRRGGRWALLI